MDSSAHKLHTIGVADNAGDTPASVKANVVNAEASAVIHRLLGLRVADIMLLDQSRIIENIENRIFSIVNEGRASISRADFRNLMDTNLINAFQQIRPTLDYAHSTQRERSQAIARAAYESIPTDVIDQLSIISAPVNIALNNGQPTSMISIPGIMIDGAVRNVLIDMNHPFWRQNTFGNQAEIEQAIDGLSGREIGMLTSVSSTHRLSPTEAHDLAYANFNITSPPSIAVEENLPVVLALGAAPVNLKIRTRLMLDDRTGSDAPSGLQNRNIATFSPLELSQLLQFRDSKGEFSFWKKYVDAGSNLPNTNDASGNSLAMGVALRLHVASFSTRSPSSERIMVGGAPVTLTLDRQALFLGRTSPAAPPGLQSRAIATMTPAEVVQVLAFRNGAGRYPYWNRYVASNALPPTHFDSRMRSLGSIVNSMITDISRPIGETQTSLTDVARDVSVKHEEGRVFLEKLKTGSENPQGAAAAATFAFSDPRVFAAVASNDNDTKLNKEVSDSQKKIQILKELQKLRDLQVSYKIPTINQVPPAIGNTPATLERLIQENDRIQSDIGLVASGGIANNSGYAHSIGIGTAVVNPANKNSITSQLQSYQRQIGEDIASYQKVIAQLQLIRRDAVDVELYTKSDTLRQYITDATGATVSAAQFSPSTLPVNLAEEIKKEMAIESEADLKTKIEKAEASLKKSKAGGETGDVLQQRIFEEHFKRQGLSEAEAKKSANYMYARSLVDHELTGQIRALEEDLFEEHVETGWNRNIIPERFQERKPQRILASFAHAVGLHSRSRGRYNWQVLSYPKLVTSYFGLKTLYEGGRPGYIDCSGSPLIKRNMRAIAHTLAERHVPMLMNDFGNDLSDEDRAKLQSRKTLSVETLEKFLTGEAPERYRPRIDHVLHHTDERTDRNRRGIASAARYTGNSAKTAARLTGASMGKAASYTKNSVKLAKDVTWKNRKNIATFALFTAFGGPMGMAAWGIYKSLDSRS